jgi:hypothetical protein
VTSSFSIFRPFIWLAVAGFITGFAGFLLLGRHAVAGDAPAAFEVLPSAAAADPYAPPNPVRAA